MRPKKNQSPICKHRWFGYGINSSAKAQAFLMALAIWGSRSWFAEKRNFFLGGMTNRTSPGFLMVDPSGNSDYPLVNIQTTVENHHLYWVNQLFLWPCSIANCLFTRGYLDPFGNMTMALWTGLINSPTAQHPNGGLVKRCHRGIGKITRHGAKMSRKMCRSPKQLNVLVGWRTMVK